MEITPETLAAWAPYWGPLALGAVLAAVVKIVDVAVLTPALARSHPWTGWADRLLWLVPFPIGALCGWAWELPAPPEVDAAGALYYATAGVVALFVRGRIPFTEPQS